MSKSIKILHPGIYSTIQDNGRQGYAFYAIPRSGIMDNQSYNNIKSVLNTDDNISVIECTLQSPTILFNDTMQIATSGANMQWKINKQPLTLNTLVTVHKGDILKGGYATSGYRGYIGFSKQMEVSRHFDSVSSYSYASLGANNGQPLIKEQVITFKAENSITNRQLTRDILSSTNTIHINKGPEYSWMDSSSQEILTGEIFRISAQSNRMGARLDGPPITTTQLLSQSVPVLPGFIQLLPSGQLIVLLQDGQTTGGYPRIGYLSDKELVTLNQVPIGKSVRFMSD